MKSANYEEETFETKQVSLEELVDFEGQRNEKNYYFNQDRSYIYFKTISSTSN